MAEGSTFQWPARKRRLSKCHMPDVNTANSYLYRHITKFTTLMIQLFVGTRNECATVHTAGN